jgi:competence protein ComEC
MSLERRYFFFLLFLFLPFYFFRLQQKLKLSFQEGEKVKIKGRLTQEPTLVDQKQTFKIKGILIKLPSWPKLHYADQVEITGTIKTSASPSFFNQFYLVNPQVRQLKPGKSLFQSLFKFPQRLEKIFNQTLPEPQASLLSGIVLGIQKTLAQDFYQALQTTGTLHIVVASGMNISLVAGTLIESLSRFLQRKPAFFVSLVCILIYCIMAGLKPPIVRAGLMAALFYFSQLMGKETLGLWALTLVAALMLLIDPLLLFDVGCQLSFAATTGLLTLGSFFQSFLGKIRFLNFLAKETGETLAAMVLTAPILIINFGHFNPLALIPNVLILWLIEYLMSLGLSISFFGLFFWPLAQFLAWLAWLPLTYLIQVINFFSRFSVFDWQLEGFSWLFGLGYYLILFSLLSRRRC